MSCVQGGYTCGPCKKGYMGDSFYGCYPDDFCAEGKDDCHSTASCIYVGPGLFRCEVWNITYTIVSKMLLTVAESNYVSHCLVLHLVK